MSDVHFETVKMQDGSRYHRARCLTCSWEGVSMCWMELYHESVAHTCVMEDRRAK